MAAIYDSPWGAVNQSWFLSIAIHIIQDYRPRSLPKLCWMGSNRWKEGEGVVGRGGGGVEPFSYNYGTTGFVYKKVASLLRRSKNEGFLYMEVLIRELSMTTSSLLTYCRKSQLPTDDACISAIPSIVTHSAPGTILAELHTAFRSNTSSL